MMEKNKSVFLHTKNENNNYESNTKFSTLVFNKKLFSITIYILFSFPHFYKMRTKGLEKLNKMEKKND